MSLFGKSGQHEDGRRPTARRSGTNSSGKKNRAMKVAGIVLCCVALLVLLGIIAFNLWSKAPEVSQEGPKIQTVSTPEPVAATAAPPEASAEPVAATDEPEATPVAAVRDPDTYTVLVVGRDRVGMNIVFSTWKSHTPAA